MTRIKICGITNQENAKHAVDAGAWALGFVFYKKSPRYISPSRARKIIESLPPFISTVGVFVDAREGAIKDICNFTRINALQFHGDEEPQYCQRFKDHKIIKAFRVKDDFNFNVVKKYKVDAYLFDTHVEGEQGGTGKAFNWNLMKYETFDRPYILSGGLNAANVKEAIQALKPYAVDVSSGVEVSPGIKDHQKIQAFVEAVKSGNVKIL